jgi:O-antigen ligase
MIIEGFIRLMSISHMLSIASTQMFLGCLVLYSAYLSYKKQYTWSDFPYRYYFLGLILLTMLSAVLAVDIKRSLPKMFNWWLYLYFIAMFLMALKKDILATVTFYAVVGADIAALYGLYQFVFTNASRAEGFFTHALTYGNTLSMIICMIMAILATRFYRHRHELVFYAVSGMLTMAALFVSVARGPMLATLATLFIMLTIYKGVKGFLASSIILVLILGSIVAIPAVRTRYVEFVDNSWKNEETAMGVRIPLWKASLEIIRDYPYFGIGERNFRQTAKAYIGRSLHVMSHAHNAFLHFAVTHGLVAFSILVGLIVKLGYDTLPGALRREPTAFAAVSVLFVFLLEGMTENTIGDSEVAMLFYFLMGTFCGTLYRKGINGPLGRPVVKASGHPD